MKEGIREREREERERERERGGGGSDRGKCWEIQTGKRQRQTESNSTRKKSERVKKMNKSLVPQRLSVSSAIKLSRGRIPRQGSDNFARCDTEIERGCYDLLSHSAGHITYTRTTTWK